ncbi:MAG: DUF5667 domain-containing protein [Candidatus Paceibacterota bacterium]|jgi:hypothetical protein
MNNEFESTIKKLKNIRLSDEEKGSMRAFLLENSTPLSVEQNVTNKETNRLYYYYQFIKNYYFMINKNKFVPTLVIVLVIATTGGTAAFAEKAIPGDLLYGVKTYVNEPVAGIFAFTKEEKTEWKERLVERRLSEAQKLVSLGNFSEVNRVNLENQIKTKIDDFNLNVNELALQKNQGVNSSDLNIRLQASLKAYQNVLETLSKEPTLAADTKQETDKLLASLSEFSDKIKNDNKDLELNLGVDLQNNTTVTTNSDISSASSKQAAAVNLLDSTKLTYQKEKINLSANIQGQIDSKLALAEKTLEEGKAFMTASDFVNATVKFQAVITSVNEAKLLMFSNVIKGDIEDENDIEGSGDIEEDDQFEDVNDDKSSDDSKSVKEHSNGINSLKIDLNLGDDEED